MLFRLVRVNWLGFLKVFFLLLLSCCSVWGVLNACVWKVIHSWNLERTWKGLLLDLCTRGLIIEVLRATWSLATGGLLLSFGQAVWIIVVVLFSYSIEVGPWRRILILYMIIGQGSCVNILLLKCPRWKLDRLIDLSFKLLLLDVRAVIFLILISLFRNHLTCGHWRFRLFVWCLI